MIARNVNICVRGFFSQNTLQFFKVSRFCLVVEGIEMYLVKKKKKQKQNLRRAIFLLIDSFVLPRCRLPLSEFHIYAIPWQLHRPWTQFYCRRLHVDWLNFSVENQETKHVKVIVNSSRGDFIKLSFYIADADSIKSGPTLTIRLRFTLSLFSLSWKTREDNSSHVEDDNSFKWT